MRALKDKGVEDLNAIRARVRLVYAKNRIDIEDVRRIEDVLNELEAVIVNASELDANGDEIGGDF